MYFVYIIQNSSSGRYYIGSTNNLERRLSEHNRGQTKSTKSINGSWNLVYHESRSTLLDAHKRELQIKAYKGGNSFKKLLKLFR